MENRKLLEEHILEIIRAANGPILSSQIIRALNDQGFDRVSKPKLLQYLYVFKHTGAVEDVLVGGTCHWQARKDFQMEDAPRAPHLIEDAPSIPYFGFGKYASADAIGAIIGRRPAGREAFLKCETPLFPTLPVTYLELCLQPWSQLPENVKDKFRQDDREYATAHVLRQNLTPPLHSVSGVVWDITIKEQEKIGSYKMHGLWHTPTIVSVIYTSGDTYRDNCAVAEYVADPERRLALAPKGGTA